MSSSSLSRLVPALFIVACLFLSLGSRALAQGSYFGGSLTWRQTGDKTIEIEITKTLRRGLFPSATVGSTITNNWTINVGLSTPRSYGLVVTAIDPGRDKIVASTKLMQSYPSVGTYTLATTTCCRPAALTASNGSRDFRMSAQVVLAPVQADVTQYPNSPRVTMPENILRLPAGVPTSLAIPAYDESGDTIGYRFATGTESGLLNPIPGGATLDPQTGVLSMPATATAIHATQIIMDDGEGSSCLDLCLDLASHSAAPPAFTGIPAGGEVTSSIGLPTEFQIVASDPGTAPNDVVEIRTGPLPPGLELVSSLGSTSFQNTRTLTFRWTPPVDAPPATSLLFYALNPTGNDSAYTTLRLKLQLASSLYVSGRILDFKSSHPDFDLPNADADKRFVQTQLNGSTTPVFLPAPGLSSSSAATFPQWWTLDPDTTEPYNVHKTHTLVLSNGGQTNPRVFRGQLIHPIDNELFGNEGQPHNGFFTYQVNTYITPQAGDSLSFRSADDLWVFINGRLVVDLGGIHAAESASINLQTLVDVDGQPLNLSAGQTYKLDLYYAHRGQHAPELVIDLIAADPAGVCSDLATPAPLAPESFQTAGGAERLGDGTLELIEAGDAPLVSSATWFDTPIPVSQGIWLSFDYEMSADLPGFALVFADPDTPPGTVGNPGAQMGYGGIPGSVAIEFDQVRDVALGDPPFTTMPDHFAIHSSGIQPNSAAADGLIAYLRQQDQVAMYGGRVPFGGNAVHHVDLRILFLSRDHALLQFYFDRPQPITQLTVPTFMQVIPTAAFAQAAGDPVGQIHGALKLGFTSATPGTGTGAASKLQVRNVKLGTRQLGGSRLDGLLPFNLTAGREWAQNFQLAGECGTGLVVPGRAADFTASFTRNGSGESVPVNVTDLGDGTYALDFTPTRAGQWSLAVSFDGEPSNGSPYLYTVISPYAAWAAAEFNAAVPAEQRDPQDDPDGDGMVNGLEYLTGGDPEAGGASPFNLDETPSEIVLSYPRKKSVPEGAELAELSEDLDEWLPATGIQREVEAIDAVTVRIKLRLPKSAEERRFLRVSFAGEGL